MSLFYKIQSTIIALYSGKGIINTSDDGINSANSYLKNYDFNIEINGGDWYINADGDGIDSNGSIIAET